MSYTMGLYFIPEPISDNKMSGVGCICCTGLKVVIFAAVALHAAIGHSDNGNAYAHRLHVGQSVVLECGFEEMRHGPMRNSRIYGPMGG
jgi:hypothetical protein